jgi:DNA-binding response OmpR family regulator
VVLPTTATTPRRHTAPVILGAVRVLLVEDERELAEVIASGLRDQGWAVDVALDGVAALQKVAVTEYDVMVLDRGLPGVHGDEVCRSALRADRPPRILMLTAYDAVDMKVDGLRLGADDYLTKPFAFTELVARVESLLRRPGERIDEVLVRGDLRIDVARRDVTRWGRDIAVTNREFWVLVELLRADGRVLSAEHLLERVWDEHADPFTNAVRTVVKNLRHKLGEPSPIETLVGSGYRIR